MTSSQHHCPAVNHYFQRIHWTKTRASYMGCVQDQHISLFTCTVSDPRRPLTCMCLWLACVQVRGLDPGRDSVAFALLQLYRFNPSFVTWTMAGPSLAAEPGLLLGPLPGEALKGYMHMPSFHSHIRTSQGHQSEVSSSLLRARCLSPHLPHMSKPRQATASFREAFLFGPITWEWVKNRAHSSDVKSHLV